MRKIWWLAIAMLLAGNSYADSYTLDSIIKNMTVGNGLARVQFLDGVGGFESCSTNQQWYGLDLTSTVAGTKEMYATLLSAKLTGQKLHLQLIGCVGAYSKITHVYVCDNSSCQ